MSSLAAARRASRWWLDSGLDAGDLDPTAPGIFPPSSRAAAAAMLAPAISLDVPVLDAPFGAGPALDDEVAAPPAVRRMARGTCVRPGRGRRGTRSTPRSSARGIAVGTPRRAERTIHGSPTYRPSSRPPAFSICLSQGGESPGAEANAGHLGRRPTSAIMTGCDHGPADPAGPSRAGRSPPNRTHSSAGTRWSIPARKSRFVVAGSRRDRHPVPGVAAHRHAAGRPILRLRGSPSRSCDRRKKRPGRRPRRRPQCLMPRSSDNRTSGRPRLAR
jgi:hypothetical protein